MIHNRAQLVNWLQQNSKDDVLLQNAFRHPGTQIKLLGMFDPLPGSLHSGWLIRITTYRGREDLIGVVSDRFGRPLRFYFTDHVTWDTWKGPSEDVLIGGDDNGKEKNNTGKYDRIKKCAQLYTRENRRDSTCNENPQVAKTRLHPPHVPPKRL